MPEHLRLHRRVAKLGITLPLIMLQVLLLPVGAGDQFVERRHLMVRLLRQYGIRDRGVLQAMGEVPRHLFIPAAYRAICDPYGDHPCPIGSGQTISQPYMVAYMTEVLAVREGMRVLEIGTGSGYQAAILAKLGARVYTVERIPELSRHARGVFDGFDWGREIRDRTGDGFGGWPEHAPFSRIIVTCAPGDVPQELVRQLGEGGRMVIPVGRRRQRLLILEKRQGKLTITRDLQVRFVPMVPGVKRPPFP